MWIRLQATCRCQACSELTAVNAAVEALTCLGCGAAYTLREELWTNVLAEARAGAEELDTNATTKREFDAGGVSLTVVIAALDPSCPHCQGAWNELPQGACAACGTPVSVRSFETGTLVGEDKQMLAGQHGEVEAQTISCGGCGAPLVTGGAARKLACEGCARENVVPDEIWRRLHAPRSVASWWLHASGGHSTGLRAQVRAQEMVGGAGVVYVLGGYADSYAALLAIEVDPLGLRWMVDLEPLGKAGLMHLAAAGDELFAYKPMSRAIEVFDAATGQHLRTLSAPAQLSDVAPDLDGTLVCRSVTGELIRMDAQGQVAELWAKRGFLAKIFGGGMVEQAPKKSMTGLACGRIGMGSDGELRVISRRWLGRLGRDGDLRWSAEVTGANMAIVAPAATPKGETFAVLRTVGGTMTVEQLLAHTEALADGIEQSSSALVRVAASGGQPVLVRRSGPEEFIALAVTHEGEQWLSTGEGELLRLAPNGDLLWRQARPT